jgi:hypothetical protein
MTAIARDPPRIRVSGPGTNTRQSVREASGCSHPPPHKDIDTQAVVNLRRMLTKAGYGAGVADAGANGRKA